MYIQFYNSCKEYIKGVLIICYYNRSKVALMLVCKLGSMLLNLLLSYCLQVGIPGIRKEETVWHWFMGI